MASVLPEAAIISTALSRLELLEPDKYIIALGPDSEQFIGTHNGYEATYIPPVLLGELSAREVKKITWVSFGCNPGSFFFRYELYDGTSTFRLGPNLPPDLQSFIRSLDGSDVLLSGLRVQLGANDSFVAWSKTAWICARVPSQLDSKLREASSCSQTLNDISNGSLRDGTLDNVQWHLSGSFYIKKGDRHLWKFTADSVASAWDEMWRGLGRVERMRSIVDELAHVVISSYSEKGETFAFIKKRLPGGQTPFIVHFEGEPTHRNFTQGLTVGQCSSLPSSILGSSPGSAIPSHATPSSGRGQLTIANPETHPFRWAFSKKSGRPHQNDTLELELNKSERIKVLRDMGREWYIAANSHAVVGWVHGSWIKFSDDKAHRDTKLGYNRFMEDLQKLLVPGELQEFPMMKSYVDECTRPECSPQKQCASSLGICIHDLLALLKSSDSFSYERLKEGRNLWHPDRFARFCKPGKAERLKPMSEQMFVMYGILMENCRR